jgi:hypothetical protein
VIRDGPIQRLSQSSISASVVSTHDEWYTAVSAERGGAMVLGENPPDAQWLVVIEDYPNSDFARRVLPRVHALAANGRYRAVCRRGAVTAYARSSQTAPSSAR